MRRHSEKRDAVLAAVKASRQHPSAIEVWGALRQEQPGLSLATVYRNISQFVDEGLVVRVPSGDGQERFDGNVAPHSHFVCRICNRVYDVPMDDDPALDKALDAHAAQLTGGGIEGHEVTFRGICAGCLKPKDELPQ